MKPQIIREEMTTVTFSMVGDYSYNLYNSAIGKVTPAAVIQRLPQAKCFSGSFQGGSWDWEGRRGQETSGSSKMRQTLWWQLTLFSSIRVILRKDHWEVIITTGKRAFLPPRRVCVFVSLNLPCGGPVLKDAQHFAGRVSAPYCKPSSLLCHNISKTISQGCSQARCYKHYYR